MSIYIYMYIYMYIGARSGGFNDKNLNPHGTFSPNKDHENERIFYEGTPRKFFESTPTKYPLDVKTPAVSLNYPLTKVYEYIYIYIYVYIYIYIYVYRYIYIHIHINI
jgi:hypothetical protein